MIKELVTSLREIFRYLRMWKAAWEDNGVDSIRDTYGREWAIHDIFKVYELMPGLMATRQHQAIELFLVQSMSEADAAGAMGVSRTNPVGMYATIGLTRLAEAMLNREIPGWSDGENEVRSRSSVGGRGRPVDTKVTPQRHLLRGQEGRAHGLEDHRSVTSRSARSIWFPRSLLQEWSVPPSSQHPPDMAELPGWGSQLSGQPLPRPLAGYASVMAGRLGHHFDAVVSTLGVFLAMADVSVPLDANDPSGPRFTVRRVVEEPSFNAPQIGVTGVDATPIQQVIRVGGVSLFARTGQRCRVCSSPIRSEIERFLSSPMSIAQVAAIINESDETEPISEGSLRGHQRNHMTLEATVGRVTLEQRAKALGVDPDGGIISTVAYLSLLDTVVRRSMESVVGGNVIPSVKDGLAAGKLMMEIEERSREQSTIEDMYGALVDMASIVEELLPVDRRDDMVRMMQAHPVLRQVVERMLAARSKPAVELSPVTIDAIYEPDEILS